MDKRIEDLMAASIEYGIMVRNSGSYSTEELNEIKKKMISSAKEIQSVFDRFETLVQSF